MEKYIIVAAGLGNEIGLENRMPWHMPADLQFFKKTTMKYPIIMGRKTYESIGRILPGRTNVIVSRNPEYQIQDAVHFSDFNEALKYFEERGEEKVFIIGGGEIFKMAIPIVDYVYLTRIQEKFEDATIFFPELPVHFELVWEEEHQVDDKNPHNYTYQKWKNTLKHEEK